MPEKFFDMLPFMSFTAGGGVGLNKARLTEALIIAVIAGGFSAYISNKVQEVKLEYIEAQLERVEIKVDKIYTDIYKPHPAHK